MLVHGFALLMLVVFYTAHLALPRQHYFPEQVETGFPLTVPYTMPLCRYRCLWWATWLVMEFCWVVCDNGATSRQTTPVPSWSFHGSPLFTGWRFVWTFTMTTRSRALQA